MHTLHKKPPYIYSLRYYMNQPAWINGRFRGYRESTVVFFVHIYIYIYTKWCIESEIISGYVYRKRTPVFRHVTQKKKVSTTKHRDILLIGFHRSRIIVLTFPLFVVAESGTREASTPSKARGGDKRKRGEKFRAAGGCGDAEESIGGAEWAREASGTRSGEPGRRAHSAKYEACRSAERSREAGRAAAHRGQGAEGKVCPPKYHAPGSRQ